eukprot:g19013.t1
MKHTEFSPVEDSKLWTWSVRDKMSFAKAPPRLNHVLLPKRDRTLESAHTKVPPVPRAPRPATKPHSAGALAKATWSRRPSEGHLTVPSETRRPRGDSPFARINLLKRELMPQLLDSEHLEWLQAHPPPGYEERDYSRRNVLAREAKEDEDRHLDQRPQGVAGYGRRNVLTREVAKDGDTANMPRPAAIEAGGAPVFIRPRTLVKEPVPLNVDAKQVHSLKPELRYKWLGKALQRCQEGKVEKTLIFDILTNAKFCNDCSSKLGAKMYRIAQALVLAHADLFSPKQRKHLQVGDCPLRKLYKKAASDAELEEKGEVREKSDIIAALWEHLASLTSAQREVEVNALDDATKAKLETFLEARIAASTGQGSASAEDSDLTAL